MRRRRFIFASAMTLLLCLATAMVSFRVGFSVNWKKESVGAAEGVALWGHYRPDSLYKRRFTFIHEPASGGGSIPGFNVAGFHYYSSGGLRLIGVPLWFPAGSISMVLVILLLRRPLPPGACSTCRYNLTGNTSGVCPECGTAVAGKAGAGA